MAKGRRENETIEMMTYKQTMPNDVDMNEVSTNYWCSNRGMKKKKKKELYTKNINIENTCMYVKRQTTNYI